MGTLLAVPLGTITYIMFVYLHALCIIYNNCDGALTVLSRISWLKNYMFV